MKRLPHGTNFKHILVTHNDNDYLVELTVGEDGLPQTVTIARVWDGEKLICVGVAVKNYFDKTDWAKGCKMALRRALANLSVEFRVHFWENHREEVENNNNWFNFSDE